MNKAIIFFLGFILFTGTIMPSFTIPVQAQEIIDCPDTFSSNGAIYQFNRVSFSSVDNPQQMQWNCEYQISYDESQSKNVPRIILFILHWNEELSPAIALNLDYGCKSGIEFVKKNANYNLWSLTHQVMAGPGKSAQKLSPTNVDAMLVTLVEQAETRAIPCDGEWDKIEKEFEVFDEPEKECLSENSDRAGEIVGVVALSPGMAFVKRHGEEKWVKIEKGFTIRIGDVVKTEDGKLDRLKMRLDDRFCKEDACPSIINMSRETQLCIADYVIRENPSDEEKNIIELLYGEIRGFFKSFSSRRSTMDVRTGTSYMGIRGTDFVISYDPSLDKKLYYLNEGIVDITETTTDKSVTLTAGQTLEISNGKMQPASILSSSVWDSLVEETGGVITVIPDWIKNNAGWWADDMIGDSDFAQGIQYLISEGIMTIPDTSQTETAGGSDEIPSWIKNNAGWWADGQITDDDFVKGIQYLVEQGIIRV